MSSPSRRRSVEAFYSMTADKPKLHLEIRCSGLDRVTVAGPHGSRLGVRKFASLATFAAAGWARPCRMCALEPVLDHVLRPGPRSRLVFATFTSQPSYGADHQRFYANTVSESGAARLHRIADRLGLRVVSTKTGPAAYGFLPRAGVKILEKNLRTQWTERLPVAEPDDTFVSTLWTFLDDNPPELTSEVPLCPWEAAALLGA